ncbi:hypothetical protein LEMLEM_LOCUS15725 [Lemmus lemmus]
MSAENKPPEMSPGILLSGPAASRRAPTALSAQQLSSTSPWGMLGLPASNTGLLGKTGVETGSLFLSEAWSRRTSGDSGKGLLAVGTEKDENPN